MYWFKGRQAYGVVNLLERAGVWEFCAGRGEAFPRLTPEQDARLRARYLPEVEALEELLRVDLSAWKKPRASRTRRAFGGIRPAARHRMSIARLPEIIGAGPGRTGTTWLHRVLEGRVDLPYGVKETQFFNTYLRQGHRLVRASFSLRDRRSGKIAEICPYFFHPLAPRTHQDVHSELPDHHDAARSRRSCFFGVQAGGPLRVGARLVRRGAEIAAQSRQRQSLRVASARRGSICSAARTCWSRCMTNCARSRSRIWIE